MKRLLLLLSLIMVGFTGMAQEKQQIEESDYTNTEVPMADELRSNGKIYVVVGIIMVVFAGMVVYLVSIDRKVSRLEKEIGNTDQNQVGGSGTQM